MDNNKRKKRITIIIIILLLIIGLFLIIARRRTVTEQILSGTNSQTNKFIDLGTLLPKKKINNPSGSGIVNIPNPTNTSNPQNISSVRNGGAIGTNYLTDTPVNINENTAIQPLPQIPTPPPTGFINSIISFFSPSNSSSTDPCITNPSLAQCQAVPSTTASSSTSSGTAGTTSNTPSITLVSYPKVVQSGTPATLYWTSDTNTLFKTCKASSTKSKEWNKKTVPSPTTMKPVQDFAITPTVDPSLTLKSIMVEDIDYTITCTTDTGAVASSSITITAQIAVPPLGNICSQYTVETGAHIPQCQIDPNIYCPYLTDQEKLTHTECPSTVVVPVSKPYDCTKPHKITDIYYNIYCVPKGYQLIDPNGIGFSNGLSNVQNNSTNSTVDVLDGDDASAIADLLDKYARIAPILASADSVGQAKATVSDYQLQISDMQLAQKMCEERITDPKWQNVVDPHAIGRIIHGNYWNGYQNYDTHYPIPFGITGQYIHNNINPDRNWGDDTIKLAGEFKYHTGYFSMTENSSNPFPLSNTYEYVPIFAGKLPYNKTAPYMFPGTFITKLHSDFEIDLNIKKINGGIPEISYWKHYDKFLTEVETWIDNDYSCAGDCNGVMY